MTAAEFAELLQARPIGAGRWAARCPAHQDRSPSLSVREGDDGRVLVHCFAGCPLTDILAKVGLSIRDLFAGPPPSRKQLAAVQAEQDAHARARRAQRGWLTEPYHQERKYQTVADALMRRLLCAPESDVQRLASLYHEALEKTRWWRSEAEWRESQSLPEHGRKAA
jgi:hypothetical protein